LLTQSGPYPILPMFEFSKTHFDLL